MKDNLYPPAKKFKRHPSPNNPYPKKEAVRKKGIRANCLRSARYAWRAWEEKRTATARSSLLLTFSIQKTQKTLTHVNLLARHAKKEMPEESYQEKTDASAGLVVRRDVVKNQRGCVERSSGMTRAVAEV